MFLVWSPDRTERPFSSNENAYGEIIVYICRLFRVTKRPQAENLYCTIGYTQMVFLRSSCWRSGTNSFWILQLRPHAAAVEWSTKKLNFSLGKLHKMKQLLYENLGQSANTSKKRKPSFLITELWLGTKNIKRIAPGIEEKSLELWWDKKCSIW